MSAQESPWDINDRVNPLFTRPGEASHKCTQIPPGLCSMPGGDHLLNKGV
ncbi:hypothetical protein STXM2123_4014 [Streptomyces sp. F-3]|nr:hypothetical protein STXM2123_4014 [Streptomyces sp. F-3]